MQPSRSPAAAPPGDAPPIDLDHLARQTFGDQDLQAELLALFARQARTILTSLGAAAIAPPQAADLLHTLCGSARAVGSWRVAGEAEALERGLRQGGSVPRPDRPEDLDALGRCVEQACAAIDDLSRGAGA